MPIKYCKGFMDNFVKENQYKQPTNCKTKTTQVSALQLTRAGSNEYTITVPVGKKCNFITESLDTTWLALKVA